ncbi:nitroreductase family protein [Roseobacter sp.]|uniref:nitroreductase family protein n=1 Tax=Roseobacter sp. TaxID=1907202 RepID=UPI00385FE2B2
MIEAVRTNVQLARAYLYDFARYRRFSFVNRSVSRGNRRAIIRIFTHYLEGGMAFPDVRLGYGQDKAGSIMKKIESYHADFGVDETVLWAVATLRSYIDYHIEKGQRLSELEQQFERLTQTIGTLDDTYPGGAEQVNATQIRAAAMIDFESFLRHRHSVRQYAPGPVDDDTIARIVRNAQQCPSVCNRQTCKVYALNDVARVQAALTYQAGNAGFRQEIQTVFVVTSNMSEMNLVGERYQGWIDGGIFAMTLALAVHAEGLGACFLNWSVEPAQDRALRRHLGIPDDELVITMMSAGHLKKAFSVPVSDRKPLSEVLTLNQRVS